MLDNYTLRLLMKVEPSDSIFVDWDNHKVVKVIHIENILCRKVMYFLTEWYKELGIPYESEFRRDNLITRVDFMEILQPGVTNDPFKHCREYLTPLLTSRCSMCKEIMESCKLDKIEINTRDDKERNFFIWNGNIYLLDIADFFLVGYKDGEEVDVLGMHKSKYAKEYIKPKSGRNLRRINNHKYYFCY